ncbi:MAG TPA: PAS domain S-box protein, partial [Thermoanaerobaculaceae bacterium]|nr:PAS domain S-box protein [Thermoanaerobaculaceae bacterium]
MEQLTSVTGVAVPSESHGVLFEEAPDGIVRTDRQGHVVVANRRFCELTGYPREELHGRRLADRVIAGEPPSDPFDPDDLRPGQVVVRETRLALKDGGGLEAEVSLRKLADGGALAVVRDVTERKKLQAVL